MQPEIINVTVPAFQYLTSETPMPVLVYKNPEAKEQSPVVIFSHGRPGTLAARAAQKSPVHPNIVRYWHSHGYSVVAASEFFAAPAVGENGHSMQVNGMNIWTSVVDRWLEQNRF